MTYPSPYPENDEVPSPSARPKTIDTSFWLGVASAVIGFVLLGVSFAAIGEEELRAITRATAAQGRPLTLEQARALYQATSIALVILFLIIAALWIMFLFFMRNGRNWARIVVTVVAAIWIVFTAPSVLGGAGGVLGVLVTTLQLLAILGTVMFAFLKPSQAYFDKAARSSR